MITLPAAARTAAVLALASAVVHVLLLDASSLGSLAMVGMALACLPCAWHLWHSPAASVWATTAAVDAGMLLLHGPALMSQGGTAGGHQHGAASGSLGWLGLALVAAQLGLALTALLVCARRRAVARGNDPFTGHVSGSQLRQNAG